MTPRHLSTLSLLLTLLCGAFLPNASGQVHAPTISAAGVVSSASYAQGASPGSIISVFGSGLATSQSAATDVPLPTNLGGTQLIINGFAAPLFFVSPNQLNAQVPWQVAGAGSLSIQVLLNSVGSALVSVATANASPGLFTTDSSGIGQGVVVFGSGELVAPAGTLSGARPANPGEFITIYCTGLGPVTNQPPTGAVASAQPLSETKTTPIVTIGGTQATVSFAGLTPGSVGLYQINAQVPVNASGGSAVPVAIQVGTALSNTATIAIADRTSGVSVQVSPKSTVVPLDGTARFTAMVANASNAAVIWSVNGIAGGSLSVGMIAADGTYTAPSRLPSGPIKITATSQQDSSKSADATCTVVSSVVLVLSPQTALVSGTRQVQFTASVSGSKDSTVTWTLIGPGTITATGLYNAPSVNQQTLVQVVATSNADSSRVATAVIQVTPVGVAGVVPANLATGVPVNAVISADVGKDIFIGSVNSRSLTVVAGATAVSGSVAYDPSLGTLTFRPAKVLDSDTAYAAVIQGLTSISSTAISPLQWSFRTAPMLLQAGSVDPRVIDPARSSVVTPTGNSAIAADGSFSVPIKSVGVTPILAVSSDGRSVAASIITADGQTALQAGVARAQSLAARSVSTLALSFQSTAESLVFLSPLLVTSDPGRASVVLKLIGATSAVGDLAIVLQQLSTEGRTLDDPRFDAAYGNSLRAVIASLPTLASSAGLASEARALAATGNSVDCQQPCYRDKDYLSYDVELRDGNVSIVPKVRTLRAVDWIVELAAMTNPPANLASADPLHAFSVDENSKATQVALSKSFFAWGDIIGDVTDWVQSAVLAARV